MIRVHYCKALKGTGKPIVVNFENGKERNVASFSRKNVDIRIRFKNAKGKEKKSGATTILEVIPRNQS